MIFLTSPLPSSSSEVARGEPPAAGAGTGALTVVAVAESDIAPAVYETTPAHTGQLDALFSLPPLILALTVLLGADVNDGAIQFLDPPSQRSEI
jgi:hypothetical protein